MEYLFTLKQELNILESDFNKITLDYHIKLNNYKTKQILMKEAYKKYKNATSSFDELTLDYHTKLENYRIEKVLKIESYKKYIDIKKDIGRKQRYIKSYILKNKSSPSNMNDIAKDEKLEYGEKKLDDLEHIKNERFSDMKLINISDIPICFKYTKCELLFINTKYTIIKYLTNEYKVRTTKRNTPSSLGFYLITKIIYGKNNEYVRLEYKNILDS
jgi:hypothetical protein